MPLRHDETPLLSYPRRPVMIMLNGESRLQRRVESMLAEEIARVDRRWPCSLYRDRGVSSQ